LTHIIGLSQGVFHISKDTSGETIFSREAIREGLVSSRTGRQAEDGGMRFTAREFATRVGRGVTK
jgi:hypothetical protein